MGYQIRHAEVSINTTIFQSCGTGLAAKTIGYPAPTHAMIPAGGGRTYLAAVSALGFQHSPGVPMKRSRPCFSLVLASLLLAGLGCSADQSPVAPSAATGLIPETATGMLGGGLRHDLLSCSPLPYDSATTAIGPAGGTIAVGPHTLFVPPGALDQTVEITAAALRDSVNSVQFTPEGLTFASGHPAILTLSYANCSMLGWMLPKHVAYTTDVLSVLEVLPSADDILEKNVSAPLQHFSRYAVAW